MSSPRPRVHAARRDGVAPIPANGVPVGGTLLDFWRRSASDLLNNTTRGLLADFLVARALGLQEHEIRREWDAYDLVTPEGMRVEVKSAAYVQSWAQTRPSATSLRVRKTRAWLLEVGE